MASVLIDNKFYKITLGVVKDFISNDYLNFIRKGYDSISEKVINWEMLIYCKILDGKDKGYINHCLTQLKKLIDEKLYTNLFLQFYTEQKEELYIKTFTYNEKDGICLITPEVRICENPALIKITFYCNESKFINIPETMVESELLKRCDDLRKVTYLSQLHSFISLILIAIEKSDYFINFVKSEIPLMFEIIKSSEFCHNENNVIAFYNILYLIVIKHYKKIKQTLNDIAARELVDEAFEQVKTNRINKEKLSQMYKNWGDFQRIHMGIFYKVNIIKQIGQSIEK